MYNHSAQAAILTTTFLDLEPGLGKENSRSLDNIAEKKDEGYSSSLVQKYCADTAPVWKQYVNRSEHDDGELAKILNSDLESMLLFVSVTLPSL